MVVSQQWWVYHAGALTTRSIALHNTDSPQNIVTFKGSRGRYGHWKSCTSFNEDASSILKGCTIDDCEKSCVRSHFPCRFRHIRIYILVSWRGLCRCNFYGLNTSLDLELRCGQESALRTNSLFLSDMLSANLILVHALRMKLAALPWRWGMGICITNLPSYVELPWVWKIVFAGPVQSGFLPPKWATVDRNRSRTNPDIEGTEPNHLGLVFCGPWCQFRPIQTGFFA